VVVPVWNEGRNLREWWSDAAPYLPPGSTVRVVYDRDEDDTLPVARALAAEGAPIEPLRSCGSGFPDAMMTGLLSARPGPVLVTMADLSDDLGALGAMMEQYRAGADVVVGSRFMPGGDIQGAHRLKVLLARWGSLTLCRLAGFPVRDVSNAFRLYDARLVQGLRVGRAAGFEVVMALLLAAWESGARIVEVPAVWRGRVRGKSRFRFRWLPRYALLWGRALAHGIRTRRGGARGG
jgi:dolichol-phosphate mannosyltransferase